MRPLPPEKPNAPLLRFGGRVDKTTVTLRFFGDDLDPDEVTQLLRCQPTTASRKGEEMPGRYHRVAKLGSWHLESDGDGELEEQVDRLLDRLPDDLMVWQRLHALNPEADLFCGLFLDAWNRGVELSPELLQRISERHLRLSLDIYGSEDIEVETHNVPCQ